MLYFAYAAVGDGRVLPPAFRDAERWLCRLIHDVKDRRAFDPAIDRHRMTLWNKIRTTGRNVK
jgi:hypothetical protein